MRKIVALGREPSGELVRFIAPTGRLAPLRYKVSSLVGSFSIGRKPSGEENCSVRAQALR